MLSSPVLQYKWSAQDSSATHRVAGAQLPDTPLALRNLDLCRFLLAHPGKLGQDPFLRAPPTFMYISQTPDSAPKPRMLTSLVFPPQTVPQIYSCVCHSSEELEFWTTEIRKTFYTFFSFLYCHFPSLKQCTQRMARNV